MVSPTTLVRTLSGIAALLATLVLVGWVVDIESLANFGSEQPEMKVVTAVCVLLIAASLSWPGWRGSRYLALLVAAAALATMAAYVFDVSRDTRPAGATAVMLLCLSVGRLVLSVSWRRWCEALAMSAAFFAGVAMLGHLYGSRSLYEVGLYDAIGFPTPLVMMLLVLALMVSVPAGLAHWTLYGDDAGAVLQRRLLPFALLVLPVLGLVRILADTLTVYDERFGLALNITIGSTVLAAMIVRAGVRLRAVDRERKEAHDALAQLNEVLEQRVRERSETLEHERTLVAVLQDRGRIARDLHDRVIQRVFAAGLQLSGVAMKASLDQNDVLTDIVEELDRAIKELRQSIFELGSAEVDEGVSVALAETTERISRILGHRPTVVVHGDLGRIERRLADQLVAVLHEALTNVAKHASATSTAVSLRVEPDQLVLQVSDDGIGLSAATATRSGMANIEQRALALGGSAAWEPGPAGGAQLTFRVPTNR